VARFPPKETFIRAVCNKNNATWPKLTIQLIHKYIPDSDETANGHLKGQPQGVRSTKQKAFKKMIEVEEARIKSKGDSSPFCPLPPTKLNNTLVRVEDLNEEIHTDQTGAFPHTSQRCNRYIMVAVHLDINYIFAKPMKNRMEGESNRVYQKILNRMKAAGLGLKKQVLGNKCSAAMKACIKENGMGYKLIPPGQHRHNQAERAIQTFKAHFISILAGVDDEFPLLLWCHLLEPTELTLNLLRQSRVAAKNLGICARPRHPRLHAKYICPDWLCGPYARQARQLSVMGHKIGARFQPGHIHGTPPMFQGICDKDKSNKDQQHRHVQAPIHDKSNDLT
jgi:hypothetical protein